MKASFESWVGFRRLSRRSHRRGAKRWTRLCSKWVRNASGR